MTPVADLAAAANELRQRPRVLVACHEAPDGDALGSLVGAGLALRAGGWDVVLWAPGEAPLPADYAWLGYDEIVRTAPDDAGERLLLALDCGSAARLGSTGDAVISRAEAVINLDHHADNTRFGTINAVDSASPCATILVLRLLRLLDLPIALEVATALYVGIVTDTGGFMYGNTSSAAHHEAAALIDLGVQPDAIFRRLYEGKPVARTRLLARALSSLQLRLDGRLAVASVTIADLDATGAEEADSEGTINHLRSLAGVEVAAVVREPRAGEGRIRKVSLRSASPSIDVAAIAHTGGGGGHAMAAGFSSEADLDAIIALIEAGMRHA